jgi:hypothetical protein
MCWACIRAILELLVILVVFGRVRQLGGFDVDEGLPLDLTRLVNQPVLETEGHS